MFGIDAAPPDHRSANAAVLQLVAHRFAWRLGEDRRPMEPAQPLPDQRLGNPGAVMAGVLREIRVIRRDERHVVLDRVAPTGQAERALGGDVDDVRLEGVEKARHGSEPRHGEANRRIRWKRRRRNSQLSGGGLGGSSVCGIPRCHNDDFVTEGTEHMNDPRDHRRDAVHLRRVRV